MSQRLVYIIVRILVDKYTYIWEIFYRTEYLRKLRISGVYN